MLCYVIVCVYVYNSTFQPWKICKASTKPITVVITIKEDVKSQVQWAYPRGCIKYEQYLWLWCDVCASLWCVVCVLWIYHNLALHLHLYHDWPPTLVAALRVLLLLLCLDYLREGKWISSMRAHRVGIIPLPPFWSPHSTTQHTNKE